MAREIATTDVLTGDRILRIAAEYADIVSVAGACQVPGRPPGTLRIATADELDDRIRQVHRWAGPRAARIEWHTLIQAVVETTDRHGAAVELARRHGNLMSPDELLRSPLVLVGTVDEMAAQLRETRDRFGFTYFTVHEPHLHTFAPVIERLRH